jgi:SAM-dependent methyltransferase
MNPLRALYLRLLVSPNPFRMDPRLDRLVESLCAKAPSGSHVLNLGARATDYEGAVLNLDLEPFPGVDVVADGARLPFRNGTFTLVLLRGVLEHVSSAESVMWEVERVLEPWGQVYIEVPFLQPFHASPVDYRRFTLPGLRRFLTGFDELEAGVQIGPFSSLAWVLQESLASLLAFGSARRYRGWRALVGWSTFWLKYLDRWVEPGSFVPNSASALYFLGRKRG